jgi:hypothetical protein
MATRDRTGGLIDMVELKKSLEVIRGRNAADISE